MNMILPYIRRAFPRFLSSSFFKLFISISLSIQPHTPMFQSHIHESSDYTPPPCSFNSTSSFTIQGVKDNYMPELSAFETLLSTEKFLDALQHSSNSHDLSNNNQQYTHIQDHNGPVTLESLLYTGDVLFPSAQQTQQLDYGYTGYFQDKHNLTYSIDSSAKLAASVSSNMLSPQSSIFNVSSTGSLSPLPIELDYFNNITPSSYHQRSQDNNISIHTGAGLDTSFIADLTGDLCNLNPNAASAIDCISVPESLTSDLPASFFQNDRMTAHTGISSTPSNIKVEQPASYELGRRLSVSSYCSTTASSFSSLLLMNEDGQHSETASDVYKPTRHNNMYHCDYKGCTKAFTRTYNLKSHRRTHTDEKPFVCDVCPKAFARQHDRNRHAKLHLGIKPYPCQFCTKSFARQDALNRHLKRDKKTPKNSSRRRTRDDKKDTSSEEKETDQDEDLEDNGSVDLMDIYPPPCLMTKMKQKQAALRKKKVQQKRQLEQQQQQERRKK